MRHYFLEKVYDCSIKDIRKAATELYEEVKLLVDQGGGDDDASRMGQIMEKLSRLAIYGFVGGKHIDQETKDILVKSPNIPGSVQTEDHAEENKDIVFSLEMVHQINPNLDRSRT
ncbi:hypothetical protein DFQ28_009733 [Apophysomyces sp. BC1034]|nr:hypothetical protein DFQ28_009733 [Apophysomyces sp. BC1034]